MSKDASRRPDFAVFGLALDNQHWKKCGAAWRRTKNGTPYIGIKLDFMPRGGQLTLWPVDEDDRDEVDLPPPADVEIPFG